MMTENSIHLPDTGRAAVHPVDPVGLVDLNEQVRGGEFAGAAASRLLLLRTPDGDLLRSIGDQRGVIAGLRAVMDGLRFAGHDANGVEWRRGLAGRMATFERLLGYHDASVAEALDRGLPVPAWPLGPAPSTGRVAGPAHRRPPPAHPDGAGVPAESGVRGSRG